MKMGDSFYQEIIGILKQEKLSKQELSRLKIQLCKKYKIREIPTDIQILMHSKPKDLPKLKHIQTKPVKTGSGVSPIAIMTKPISCKHGRCIMCPGGPESFFGNIPQSYTGKEPATMRAIRNKFDPYLQVFNRLEQYYCLGHCPEKVELIIMGGTFPSFPTSYQNTFIKYAFKAMNDFSKLFFRKGNFDFLKFKKFFGLPGKVGDPERIKQIYNKLIKLKGKCSLEKEQKKNENAKIKCVALCIETRPDYARLSHGNQMLKLGCTRVELGVQTIDDKLLKNIERGHSVEDSIKATRTLKDLGFKVGYHAMIGLPGSDKEKDIALFEEIFSNNNFKPDFLKIYPCMVLKGTKLYDLWKKRKYKALNTKKASEIIAEAKRFIPYYTRIMRVQRDISTKQITAGVDRTNLRQYVELILKKKGINCSCIRCREINNVFRKTGKLPEKTSFVIAGYSASKGKEYFISAQDIKQNILIGFCRLRFPSEQLRKEISKDSALIRELHVYGQATGIGKKGVVQHKGVGKKLMKIAENIARQHKKKKIVVISGVGVRDYYRNKLGYKKEGPYMVKYLR